MTNFINNRNFKPNGNPEKLIRWFESIAASDPRDAAMCAMLAYGYRLLGNNDRARLFRKKFHTLVEQHDYWKRRVEEFPELLVFVDGQPVDGRVAEGSAGEAPHIYPEI